MRRIWRRVFLGAIGLTMLLWLILFPPLPRVPTIAQDLPSNLERANEVFVERVRTTFPIGMSEATFLENLREMHFNIDETQRFAVFEKPQFPCRLIPRISYEAENGILTELRARHATTCL